MLVIYLLYWYLFVDAINKASEPWGISCLRYEISKYIFLRKLYTLAHILYTCIGKKQEV